MESTSSDYLVSTFAFQMRLVPLHIVSGVMFGLLFFCPLCILFGPRYAGSSWKDTVTLSVIGSPLHGLSSVLFFTFLIASLADGPRAWMTAGRFSHYIKQI
jgi:hypothetical protein